LNWAAELKLIRECPKFRVPKKQGDLAAGRALCGEEHDRIKEAVKKVMPEQHVAAWQRFLDGLLYSGFRLGELLALSWEPTAAVTAIVIEGQRPVVRFKAAGQKARRDEIWPCPPEFAAMLEAVPEAERTGFVFAAPMKRKGYGRAKLQWATYAISEFGKKAGVITGETPEESATAHDYRRTFGTKWAKRVMPAVLKRLMRHACISTTMAYYVTADAAEIADELWQKFGNGNTLSNTAAAERQLAESASSPAANGNTLSNTAAAEPAIS
jgi:integrase